MLRKSKRFLSLLCALVVLISSYAGYAIPFRVTAATAPVLNLEEDVKWFGRTFAENGKHYFSWSNSGFQFTFYGTGATATLQSTLHNAGNTYQTAYIKIYVDGVLSKDIAVPETETSITLASGLEKGTHTIKVIKRTSGYYSIVGLSKIQLDAGSEIRETQKYYDRKMLFIGDNLTAGYASLESSYTTTDVGTAKEDSTLSYTALAADYFGAENMTVALTHAGGRGIVNNGNKTTTHIASDFFEYLDYREKQSVNYDHTQYDPDIVVINFGSYDYESGISDATTFKAACKDFILQVRSAYPEAKILYTYGIVNTGLASTISTAISELNAAGYKDIYYKSLSTITSNSERGYNKHPSTASHVKYSKELIAAVEDIMGWTGANTPGNPVSREVPVDTLYQPFEQTDISVMSYNVLSHNSSSQNYEAYGNRMAKVATMIKAYDPDIIGLQEVSKPYDTYTHDWPGYLNSNCTEYASVRLDTQANNSNLMRIGNGLMIMYKKDRFDLVTSGCQQYKTYTETNSNYGSKTYTVTDTSRWFHWVQLKDKTTGQVFYLYNTHLTVNGSTPVADRVSQCRILAQHIVKTNGASSCPFFITGDFNTTLDAGDGALEKLINYNKKDDGASAVELFNDGASVADYTRFSDRGGSLDHVFVANRYIDVKEFHVAVEGVDGRRTSDHSPHIAYCNFKPHTTAGLTTGLDESGKVFKASTSASTYTFNFTLGTSVTYSIYDETGTAVSGTTVNLNKRTNRFGLYFKDGKGNHVCTIEAVITNTSIAEPALTATGSVVREPYFANGAYHVLANGDSLNLSASNASFYTNPYASRSLTLPLTSIAAGRTTYYLKTTAGDVYPVYIYKQTATADSSILYVDDDIGLATTGKVAFYDGKDVVFVTKGTNGFATVSEVATKANASANSTVLFAPGHYDSNEVVFTKDVTLLGNNHDVSAVEIKTPNWAKAGRKDETVIDGGIIFQSTGDISVTVKGFTIEGTSTNGPIYVKDTTSDASTRGANVKTLDIQNNIITGGGNGSSSSYASAVHTNSGAQIKGLIKNNYFKSTLNQDAVGDKGKTRAIVARNTNGFVIDSNYFIGYSVLFDFTDEVASGVAGGSIYSVIGNRFEHCGTAKNYLKGITSNTSANISYLNNDFVRCSGENSVYTVYFDFTQGSLGNDCSKINISIIGNRFADCYRSLQFTRSHAAAQTGNLAESTVRVNRNSFINPTEGSWKKYFRSIDISFGVVGAGVNGTISPDKWNFSDNHFESAFLVTELAELQAHSVPYRTDIYEMNYIRHYATQSLGSESQSFVMTSEHFTKKLTYTYDNITVPHNDAGGVYEDGYSYNFDDDTAGMNLYRGVSAIKDVMVPAVNTEGTDSITITNQKTLELKGRTSFYTESRWTSTGQVEFALKTDATSNSSNRSAVHFKYGHGSISATSLTNSVFYSGKTVEGFYLTFATISGVPTIAITVVYNSSGTRASTTKTFANVVSNMDEFNTYKLVESELGTIDVYANNKRFARILCFDDVAAYSLRSVTPTETTENDAYYNNVEVYAVDMATDTVADTPIIDVTNSLVTKHSALAFATSNSTIANGQTMEIDNLRITSTIDEIVDDPVEPTATPTAATATPTASTAAPTATPTVPPVVDTPGTITITKAQAGVNYSAYKMANVIYNEESDAYSYKVADGWEEFFAGTGDYAVVLDVYSVNGNVITKRADADESKMPEIARLAVKYAQENNITAAGSATADGNGTAVINVSSAGYYVVDSALGALCSVGTFNGSDGNVNIQEKNDVPTLQKFVKEEDTWQKANDESIGNIVEFKILVYVAKGAKGYVVHDTLGDGFTAPTNVVVKQYSSYVNNGAATLTTTYVSGNHYTVSISGNSLTVTFNDDTIENVPVGNILEITYQASIDTDAAVDAANVNTAYMQYGETEGLQTVSVITNTYVWSFGIHKYYGNDIGLPGASFELYDTNPVGNDSATPMQFVYDAQTDTYRLASQADINIPKTSVLVSPDTGDYRIQGLDSATYYLVEKEAPAGFNKLGAPIAVTIASSQVDNTETQLKKLVTAKQGLDDVAIIDGDIIPVLNQSGIVLPDTGGYASVFVAVGCMMVMSMGILLVVRKRMTKVIYIKNDDYYEEFDD